MIIVGIDPSSLKIAFVWTGNDKRVHHRLAKLPKDTDFAFRCASAYASTRVILTKIVAQNPGQPVFVFIEEPVVGRGGAYATISQSKVHGAIVAAAYRVKGVERVSGANNSTAKKQVVGNGAAKKEQIADWAAKYWRELYDAAQTYNKGDRQDIIDAGMVNRYGDHVLKVRTKVNRYRDKQRKQRGSRHGGA
ncbi:RuvC-like resolvase [Gordonia phage ChisanaKitsune]|uniref:RuvC-like resolvase n=1 Tax=Gordonia phage ChisanaKitsune TaxID=2871538 RepID=A0AAE8BX99_9CAUD|nr:RuvC-like Holliday junction resolvase [Gordonia phage ChisanaKitsune]QZE10871.1 RuvC-like resolvase [Gordonia phage ChisanaKitsune]